MSTAPLRPPLRVIHLTKMTGLAGSERHLLTLLAGQRRHGLDARLWALVEPGQPVPELDTASAEAGIPVERLTIRRHLDPVLWRELVRRLHADAPDLLHTHLLHADLHGIIAGRRADVRHIVSSRHNDNAFRRRLPLRLLHRWLWQQVDAGIAISEAIRQFCITVEGAAPEKIHTIRYGLDPATIPARPGAHAELRARLNLPADAILAGSICRLIEQKGLSYSIAGFATLAPDFPQVHYVIAGDGNQRAALEAQVRGLNLADRVHFLGWQQDSHAIFAGLDVFLAPSLWEGFGLVFLEAMAHRLPIIASRVSAIPEIVTDGETGWLVPPRDAEAITQALRAALSDPAARGARGEAGHARLIAHFTSEAMIARTIALYQSLDQA